MWATDPQVGWFMMKVGQKFIIGAKADSNKAMYEYLKRNHTRLAKEIEGKKISEI